MMINLSTKKIAKMKNQFSLLIFLLLSLIINDALFSRSTGHNCFLNYNVNNDVKYVKIYFRYYMNPGDTPPNFDIFDQAIETLNLHYKLDFVQQFYFFYTRCEVEIITNRPNLSTSISASDFFNQNNLHQDGITVHTNNASLEPNGRANGIPSKELYITFSNINNSWISHEVGHCLGLYHTHQGVCETENPPNDECEDTYITPFVSFVDNDCNISGTFYCDATFNLVSLETVKRNIMNYNPAHCKDEFTECQFEKMHTKILPAIIHQSLPNNILKARSCADSQFKDYIVDCIETYDFDFDLRVHGNIIVKNGASLTIKSKCFFTEPSGIIVEYGGKLIIDETTLTKCPDAASWKGIKAKADLGYIWGWTNQPTTELILRNGAIVEHAETAINAIDQITIFNTSNVGGAKITMTGNSTIRYCTNGINLGPIYGKPELSSFTSCHFIDNDFAINLDNNNGLNLIENTFDMNYLDIEAMTSSLYVDNNTFNSGVIFHSNFPVFQGSTFINNEFYAFQPEHGITIDAHSNASDFFIQNNQFFGTGIITLGELDFDIAQNDFHDAKEGTWINDSGDNTDNFVRENSFFDNTYGNSASGINDTEYLKNCFENIDTLSIEVNELSSIHENQGIAEDAAGNCFSFSGRVGTGMTSEFFEYFVLENTLTQSCKKPGSGGNFSEESSNQELSSICGTGTNIYGSFPPLFRNCMYANGMTLEQLIAAIRAEIQTVEANTNLDPWTKKWLLAKYRRCLDRYIKQKARALISQNDRQAAISFLSAQSEFRYQSMAYGLITESGDVLGARTKLTTMIPTDTGETEYISAQHILLDYLADRTGYLPSSLTLSGLYNAGLRKHPLAGYSRSVYYTLTGQKVPVTLTHLNGGTQIRSKIESEVKINLYPNPSKGDLLIIDFENLNPDVSYKYSISDIYGKIICQNHILESKTEVPVMTLSEGIYIIKISSDEKLFYVKKWIRIN